MLTKGHFMQQKMTTFEVVFLTSAICLSVILTPQSEHEEEPIDSCQESIGSSS